MWQTIYAVLGSIAAALAIIGALARWVFIPALERAVETKIGPAIGKAVAQEMLPFVDRLSRVETRVDAMQGV